MSWEFYSSAQPKARKEHRCAWCHEPIVVGEVHHHYWGKYDGEMQSTRMHLECQEASNNSDLDETLPDETIPRGMTYGDFEARENCSWCDSRIWKHEPRVTVRLGDCFCRTCISNDGLLDELCREIEAKQIPPLRSE